MHRNNLSFSIILVLFTCNRHDSPWLKNLSLFLKFNALSICIIKTSFLFYGPRQYTGSISLTEIIVPFPQNEQQSMSIPVTRSSTSFHDSTFLAWDSWVTFKTFLQVSNIFRLFLLLNKPKCLILTNFLGSTCRRNRLINSWACKDMIFCLLESE